jgi:hypothetical protein
MPVVGARQQDLERWHFSDMARERRQDDGCGTTIFAFVEHVQYDHAGREIISDGTKWPYDELFQLIGYAGVSDVGIWLESTIDLSIK